MTNGYRNAIVTGACGGLGRALAARLLAEGASVALVGLQRPVLESLAAGAPGRCAVYTPDVSDAQAMRAKHPVALAFPPTPGAKANRVSGYGLKARALLLKELAGYVQDL